MKLKKIIASVLCAASVLPCVGTAVFANGMTASLTSDERTDMSTEIVVKDGAKAVVSMTYDDGNYDTAVWMNEMFEKYGLMASCMLITSNQDFSSKAWQDVFSKGYLSPENHSTTHMVLPAPDWSDGTNYYDDRKQNNTPENYNSEILDSKVYLEKTFNRPSITFAPSNNTLWWEAADIVKANYYAMRKGNRGSTTTVQSLTPVEGSDAKGGWYNPYMYGIDNSSLEDNKKYVQACIDNGGWFISMTHAVVNNSEKTERFTEFYKYLSEKQAANDIWVTTFANATIYLRERQNSTASAYMTDEGVFVRIKMSDTTGDGLPLSSDIFNMPLTVKTEVPENWGMVSYQLDGKTLYAKTFFEDGKKYAYIDVAPNKVSTKITPVMSTPYTALSLGDTLELCVYINKFGKINSISTAEKIYEGADLDALYVKKIADNDYYELRFPVSYTDLDASVNLSVTVNTDGENTIKIDHNFTAYDYIKRIISDTKYEAEKSIVLDIISYSRSGIRYDDPTDSTAEFNEILYESSYFDGANMTTDSRVFTPDSELIENVDVKVIGGAEIVFTPTEKYRAAGSSLEFKAGGFTLNAEKLDDGSYKLTLPVHLAASRLTVVLTDAEGAAAVTEYNLNASVAAEEDIVFKTLLQRLARLSESAKIYKNNILNK